MYVRAVITRLAPGLLCLGLLGAAACGSDDDAIQLPPVDDPIEEPTADPLTSEPDAGQPPASEAPAEGDVPADREVLGTGNVGGTVVDPQPHPIDDIAIAESYPEQLMVRFTSGDPNCTAADATATASGSTVTVTLQVGITEDALTRSCVAGDFEQTVLIPLKVGLDGRDVVAANV